MTDQPSETTIAERESLDPDNLVVGDKIVSRQGGEPGTVVKPRGDLDLADCSLIEWDRSLAQQWVAHDDLHDARAYKQDAYERLRTAVEGELAKKNVPRESLLDAETSAWIRAYGSPRCRQQLHTEGMHYTLIERLAEEWIALHRDELGTLQGDISKHRLPGFPVPHQFIVTADPVRFWHVKPVICSEVSSDLHFLIQRAELYHPRDGQAALNVRPVAFLGIRTEYSGEKYADFVVQDPNNPGRGRWVNSVELRGYASAESENQAVTTMRALAVPPSHARLTRAQLTRREAVESLRAGATARCEELGRLLQVAEGARAQSQTVEGARSARSRGR